MLTRLKFWSDSNESLFLEKCRQESVEVWEITPYTFVLDSGAIDCIDFAKHELGATEIYNAVEN